MKDVVSQSTLWTSSVLRSGKSGTSEVDAESVCSWNNQKSLYRSWNEGWTRLVDWDFSDRGDRTFGIIGRKVLVQFLISYGIDEERYLAVLSKPFCFGYQSILKLENNNIFSMSIYCFLTAMILIGLGTRMNLWCSMVRSLICRVWSYPNPDLYPITRSSLRSQCRKGFSSL